KQFFQTKQLIQPFNKKFLRNIIPQLFNTFTITHTSMILHPIKHLPFKFSSKPAITLPLSHILLLPHKKHILHQHQKLLQHLTKQFNPTLITQQQT
ncbi:hypothetical protein, partial [Staphylococcus warneri]|uniref:hypothetical protein n=1 Tax=Staphylococcus warneri TaxID=1292 RepID=UPI001C95BDCA